METHGNTSKIEFKIKCHHCTYARVEGRSYFFSPAALHFDSYRWEQVDERDGCSFLFIYFIGKAELDACDQISKKVMAEDRELAKILYYPKQSQFK